MSGPLNVPGGIPSSVPAGTGPEAGPPPEPTPEEGTWTASRALRTFSQLAFAYGTSATFACVSAVIMSIPGVDRTWVGVGAILPFVISLVISSYVAVDLLEFLWDAAAGRFVDASGPWAVLWTTTMYLLLIGIGALVAGVVFGFMAFGDLADYGSLVPLAVSLFAVCGLLILVAVVLPAVVLGPPPARWLAALAAALGGFAVAVEAVVTLMAPTGSNPFLGWMEGTFPLLNWNVGFGSLIAASAFLVWRSYAYFVPKTKRAPTYE